MFTCTIPSRSQWSNTQFVFGMAWTGTSKPLAYVWMPGEGLVVPEPVTLKVSVHEFEVGVGVGPDVGVGVGVGDGVGVGLGVGSG